MSTVATRAFNRERPSGGGVVGATPPPEVAARSAETAVRSTAVRSTLAQGLRRLTQWAHAQAWNQWASRRLTPTQLNVLDLLNARPAGLSLTQVAHELGSTAATICDCIKALRQKGYVTAKRHPLDGRAQLLKLTPAGQAIAREVASSDALLPALAGLSAAEQQLQQFLWLKMLYSLEAGGALPPQRTCVRCHFFRPYVEADSQTPHFCGQAQQPLAAEAVRFDCPVFEATDGEAQAALWEAFLAGALSRGALEAAIQRSPSPVPEAIGTPGAAHGN